MNSAFSQLLSIHRKEVVMNEVRQHPAYFQEALRYVVDGHPDLAWRSAWVLGTCMEENDARVRPFVGALIKHLPHRKEAEQREILKILERMHIDKRRLGTLFSHAAELWMQGGKQGAVRYNAFKMMLKIATRFPELKPEILAMTDASFMDSLSHGIRHSIGLMIKKLEKKAK